MPTPVTGNVLIGPAYLYYAASGSAEPPDSAITPNGVVTPPSTPPWLFVGGTNGGINVEVDTEFTDLEIDQILMSPGAVQSATNISVAAKLAEMTQANLNLAMNMAAVLGGGTGYTTLDIAAGSVQTQPNYGALLIDGWAPRLSSGAPARRRIIVRKVLSTTKVGLAHDKKTQQGIDSTFKAYWISDSILPVHIVDQTA